MRPMEQLPLTEAFTTFARAPGSVVDAALLVTRVIEPGCDTAAVRADLEQLATDARTCAGHELPPWLAARGFAGADDYYLPQNSSLAHVLKTRRGIPISLAAVLIGVAEALGLRAQGINFPGHFLVELEGALVDPFSMRHVDAATRDDWLARLRVDAATALRPASAGDVLLRMLNNLRGLAARRGDIAAELDLSGYQVLVASEPLPIRVERVELWQRAGVPAMALRELDEAIALAPASPLREALLKKRLELEGQPPTVH